MAETTGMNKKLTYLLLGLILAGGLAIRIHNLSLSSFWIDELFHVNAAKSILATGIPTLEGGSIYMRAWPFTYIVVAFFKFFGVSEITARMPAVIFGVLNIVLVFYMTRKWFGRLTALAASFLMAFYSLFVMMSRECRMYTLFQCLYLGLAYLAFYALEGKLTRGRLRRFIAGFL